jgi:superfamily II DNA/RNA helicase
LPQLKALLEEQLPGVHLPSCTGIIYCRTRSLCAVVARLVAKKWKVKCAAYHAGMKPVSRTAVLQAWMSNEVRVVCATVAFGMGIDKPDVRFVAHWNLSQSMEAFYQESGRAGRDGRPSVSAVIYSRTDRDKINFLINKDANKKKGKKGNKTQKSDGKALSLHKMALFAKAVAYCEGASRCRRSVLLEYFGDDFKHSSDVSDARCCDVCADRALVARLAKQAQDAYQGVKKNPWGSSSSSSSGGSGRSSYRGGGGGRMGAVVGGGGGGDEDEEEEDRVDDAEPVSIPASMLRSASSGSKRKLFDLLQASEEGDRGGDGKTSRERAYADAQAHQSKKKKLASYSGPLLVVDLHVDPSELDTAFREKMLAWLGRMISAEKLTGAVLAAWRSECDGYGVNEGHPQQIEGSTELQLALLLERAAFLAAKSKVDYKSEIRQAASSARTKAKAVAK